MSNNKSTETQKSISQLEEECASLKSKLVQQAIEFDIINDVVHEISQVLDLKKILDLVALRAQEIIQADSLFIPIINKEHTHYTYMAAVGKNADTVINHTFATNVGMCGWVLSKEETLYFGECSTELMGREALWERGMESVLLV
ncbi:MAG: hypothetical protein OQK58_10205, partial [Gammaproteobacteria bacterium]|nr:hypothetical protein [Gammaproteobacteria bacterium]